MVDGQQRSRSLASHVLSYHRSVAMDEYTKKHLEQYIEHYIRDEYADAFRAYATARAEEDMEHWLNVGWSVLYGNFLMKQ